MAAGRRAAGVCAALLLSLSAAEAAEGPNTLGRCRCANELWIDCAGKRFFQCADDDSWDFDQGFLTQCSTFAGEVVDIAGINEDPPRAACVAAGSAVNECNVDIGGTGCPRYNCTVHPEGREARETEFGPEGLCGCEQQFFINEDCSAGFLCTERTSGGVAGIDGCLAECAEGEILLPDFENRDWLCETDPDTTRNRCKGAYNIQCPRDPVKARVEECECDFQAIFSPDCKEVFLCNSAIQPEGGFYNRVKDEDNILTVTDLRTYNVMEIEDDGRCPGLGGFKIGCDAGFDPAPPLGKLCDWSANTLGECECPGEVFLSDDCRQGFLCTSQHPADTDGCLISCAEKEYAFIRPGSDGWSCEERPDGYECPGTFKSDCVYRGDDEDDITCHCDGEIWVDQNCQSYTECKANGDGTFEKDRTSCTNGEKAIVDQTTYEVTCRSAAFEKCFGKSVHFGCGAAGFTDDPPTTTGDGDGAAAVGVSAAACAAGLGAALLLR